MEKIINPEKDTWTNLVVRPQIKNDDLMKICREIFMEVKKNGDEALAKYSWFFDKARIKDFAVSRSEIEKAGTMVDDELKAAIRLAKQNIENFHALQKFEPCEWVEPAGFRCWQESRSIEKVGLYVPGGSAPLFSTVLMLAVPAQLAGCEEIVLCTPPDAMGQVNPAILWTAELCGVTRVYKVGGIQAIAAMTFGTDSVPPVYKIFGPGNQYVTAAKQLACNYGVAVDMPAGPSEVMVLADSSARPDFIAADLLSQAEHGPDSQVVLVTPDQRILPAVEAELAKQLADLPRKETACLALANSRCIVLENMDACLDFVNAYAPEHLILSITDYLQFVPRVLNAGSVFLGNYSPESAGDYASGTNHTLPTNAYAKAYSGVNLDAFLKKITFQEISPSGLAYLGGAIMKMAASEQLEAHRRAVEVRLAAK